MKSPFEPTEGGVCAPRGFRAAAVACGIKPGGRKRDDLALVTSDSLAVAAGTLTTNRIKAAPVKVCLERLRKSEARAVVLNSGNANACTGPEGIEHARRMTLAVAHEMRIPERHVLVCSTGRIGVRLPIERIEGCAPRLCRALDREGGRRAAKAIMTSDTRVKEAAMRLEIGRREARIGGMAKGAGMIDPNMATMLCVLTTDAAIEKRELRRALEIAVEQSFNRITVDGDMSTNDTVLLLANGRAGNAPLKNGDAALATFQEALNRVTATLAKMIVRDGEGTSKVVEVQVKGAETFAHARKVARAIANSQLVKCAWHGEDPNWGRILDAAGYSGAKVREEMVDIYYNGLVAARNGVATDTPRRRLERVLERRSFTVTVDLHLGQAEYSVYTTDLTPEYVKLNMGE